MRSIPSHTDRGRRWRRLLFQALLGATALALAGGGPMARAQAFTSGSNGTDGALSLTTPGDFTWDPTDTVRFGKILDPDNDGIYHFTTITIANGVNIRMLATRSGTRPMQWLATGAVQIDGVLDLSGQDGSPASDPAVSNRHPSIPGPGGFPGGLGATSQSARQRGSGPGGGSAHPGSNSGSSAGHATGGSGPQFPGEGQAYGSVLLEPLLGGSGGGGGTSNCQNGVGGGGGAGGGAILIASSVSVALNGSITTNGGAGRPSGGTCMGGGGSGGSIRLMGPTVSGTGTLRAQGGANNQIGVGSVGRIRVDAFTNTFTGTATPAPFLASPFEGFLTEGIPSVRVTSLGSAQVPQFPSASVPTADVNINSTTELVATIEARNIPVGTVVKLHLTPENAADQTVDCSPLQGTLQQSTATCAITIPAGFSRMHTRATW